MEERERERERESKYFLLGEKARVRMCVSDGARV